jgi:hypothetical protein
MMSAGVVELGSRSLDLNGSLVPCGTVLVSSMPERTDSARSFDAVSVKPGTARTVKTTAGAVQAGAPFDTKSVAETG